MRWHAFEQGAGVHVGHPHQRGRRRHLAGPQDAQLDRPRRARDHADVGGQPRDDAGRRQPARRAHQGPRGTPPVDLGRAVDVRGGEYRRRDAAQHRDAPQ